MTDLLQPGQHPDADQLNPFVEHALPAHEQTDVLTHLAVCPDCRATVFLALPEMELAVGPSPAPILMPQIVAPRRRWFSGWNLAWPVAAAFAALLLTVALHRQIKTPPSTTNQIAEARAPITPALAPATAPNVPVKPMPRRAPAKPEPQAIAASTQLQQVAPTASPPVTAAQKQALTYQDIQDLALQSRDTTELLKVLPGVVMQAQGTVAASSGSGTAGMRMPAPAPASAAPPAIATGTGSAVAAEANASATVIRGDALNALSDNPQTSGAQRLPSHLQALSIATSGARVLALDTARTLFLSDDSGQHWKIVRPAWEGLAARVALVSQPVAAPMAATARASSREPVLQALRGQAAAASALAPPPSPPRSTTPSSSAKANSSLSGIVTDPKGASINGATVNLTNVATSASTTVETDQAGRYASNLPAGAYRIHVYAPGFATSQATTTLAAGQPSVDNFSLAIGATTDTVAVTSVAGQVLKTEPSQPLTAILGDASLGSTPPPVFAITTDSGARWTSSDGEHWVRQ